MARLSHWLTALALALCRTVPYRGGGPAVADLLGGQVQVMFDNIPISLQLVRAGKLRALAITGPRSPLPELPTIGESG